MAKMTNQRRDEISLAVLKGILSTKEVATALSYVKITNVIGSLSKKIGVPPEELKDFLLLILDEAIDDDIREIADIIRN